METEILVVIIASIASLIIGIINIIFTSKNTSKQNTVELKKTRIELLENRRRKIEAVNTIVSDRVIDVNGLNTTNIAIYFPRVIQNFQQNSNNIFSIGHLLNVDFITELKKLNKKIDLYIMLSKQNMPIDENDAQLDIQLVSAMSEKMQEQLFNSLQVIEKKINTLLK